MTVPPLIGEYLNVLPSKLEDTSGGMVPLPFLPAPVPRCGSRKDGESRQCVTARAPRCVSTRDGRMASEVALARGVLSGHHWRTRIAAWTQSSRLVPRGWLARSEAVADE